MSKARKTNQDNTIIVNKKARHDYFLDDLFEAGIVLTGWEVKSIRAKKTQIKESYIIFKNKEAWLVGCQITPLATASAHTLYDSRQDRKLLLHAKEAAKIFSRIQKAGQTCVATKLYWKKHLVKCQIALARGKKEYDKRATLKEREWNIEKERTMKQKI